MIYKEKGFTLIELLVVIAIIATLASVVLASLNAARAKSRDSARAAEMQQVQTAIQSYYLDHGGIYPADGADPYYLRDIAGGLNGYIDEIPGDPVWAGQSYDYRYYSNSNAGFVLLRRVENTNGEDWCRVLYGSSSGWAGTEPLCQDI